MMLAIDFKYLNPTFSRRGKEIIEFLEGPIIKNDSYIQLFTIWRGLVDYNLSIIDVLFKSYVIN